MIRQHINMFYIYMTCSMQLHSRGNIVRQEAAMGKQHSTKAAEPAPWGSAHSCMHSVALSTLLLKPLSKQGFLQEGEPAKVGLVTQPTSASVVS